MAVSVAYQLRMPGRTLALEPYCGAEEHQHSEECKQKVLICTEDHIHNDACYEEQLVCGKTEHIHTADCYSEKANASEPYPFGVDEKLTKVRPMMQKVITDGSKLIDQLDNEYEQIYTDKESYIRAVVDNNGTDMIEVQITNGYDNYEFSKVVLHKHATDKYGAAGTGTACLGEGHCNDSNTYDSATSKQITWENAKDEDGLSVVIVRFVEELVDGSDWSLVPYYDVAGERNLLSPATFFDYTYSNQDGIGINNEGNYENSNNNTPHLAVGLKDNFHPGSSNHNWTANIAITDGDGKLLPDVIRDANGNNGQNDSNSGYPVIQGLIKGLSKDSGYTEVIWKDDLDQPGFFSAESKIGKTIYNDYDLDFYNIGNRYVLNGAFNNTTQKMSTDGVYHKANNTGAFSKGGNFWPLDDQPAGEKFTNQWAGYAEHNWYFGMRYDVSFSITEDYIGSLDFTFAGDDDMWVFLDGELVLDLGGMHSAYPTRYDVVTEDRPDVNKPDDIEDFHTEYTYGNMIDFRKYIKPGDTAEHIITVLYMERGGYDSNCYMEFTLPNLKLVSRVIKPNAELDITKKDQDGNALANTEFTLYRVGDNGKWTEAPYYIDKTLTDTQIKHGKMVTDKNGKFHAYGIADGEYVLKETKPLAGFENVDEPIITFTVEDGIITKYNSSLSSVEITVAGVQIKLDVKNTREGEAKINVKAVKRWSDELTHSGDSVTVTLYKDGKPFETVVLNASNNWEHIWNDMEKSADDGHLYKYTVVEDAVPGYTPEYVSRWIYGENAWIKTDKIVNGEKYILTNGTDMAMYVTSTGAQNFTDQNNFPIVINGDVLTADSIPSNILWETVLKNQFFAFKNVWSTENKTPKYLSIQDNGKIFKTANNNYESYFSFADGKLKGFIAQTSNPTGNPPYRVRYENGKFAAGSNETGSNIVPFVYKASPDTYEIAIVNNPVSGVELPETGGTGVYLYILGGLLFMAIPVMYIYLKRRCEGGEDG